jgi:hypothetical protein
MLSVCRRGWKHDNRERTKTEDRINEQGSLLNSIGTAVNEQGSLLNSVAITVNAIAIEISKRKDECGAMTRDELIEFLLNDRTNHPKDVQVGWLSESGELWPATVERRSFAIEIRFVGGVDPIHE